MAAPLIPQEIYLLERYSSLEYFGQMRDAFGACTKAAEDALAEFMRHLPPDYRSKPLHEQPDIVWGERILPNMQWAVDGLNEGYNSISNQDLSGLGFAGNVDTTFAAINRDYSSTWMPAPFEAEFDKQWRIASQPASNISFTEQSDWTKGALTTRYKDDNRGPLAPPPTWPQYRLNPSVRVRSGEPVPRNGIYLPDSDLGCAQLLIKDEDASQVLLPRDPSSTVPLKRSQRSVDTIWTLVERVADCGGGTPGEADPIKAGMRLRCEANQPCPREGWWFTPTKSDSRQKFKQGQVMPTVGGDYGTTIWQWDETQG
jgi:hypothetical protein